MESSTNTQVFTTNDFIINAPDGLGIGPGLVTTMALPHQNGFSANVCVMVQEYKGSIADYDLLTQRQIYQAKFEMITSKVDDDSATYEYQGRMNGFDLHFYAIAIKGSNNVYLVTATGLQKDWKLQGESLVKSVNSFRYYK